MSMDIMGIKFFNPLLVVGALLCAGSVSAAIIGSGDGGRIIDAPMVIDDDTVFCNVFSPQGRCEMLGFDEQQSLAVVAPIVVDDGVIGGGDINSHMIFLNTMGLISAKMTVDWWFDGKIIGVMSDRNGVLEAQTSGLLGASGTLYPDAFPLRGLENGDWYRVAGNQLTFHSYVKEPGDWIRVVTRAMIPVPSTSLLLLVIIGLFGWRRGLSTGLQ